jgi:hypothetical protein
MDHHLPSFMVGSITGMASLAVPDGITTWLGKIVMGVLIAVLSGLVHGCAQRWASGKKKGEK